MSMGRKLDRMAEIAVSIGAAVNVWDRFQRWRRARADALAEERRLEAFERDQRAAHELALLSDEANRNNPPCLTPGCRRPRHHGGEHGAPLGLWPEDKRT